MPPKRPRTHETAELGIIRLHEAFVSSGWTVEELDRDYGEDLLVRVFEDGEVTPYTFYVQAKSAESLNRYLRNNGSHIKYPMSSGHLSHWERFQESVILAIWDRSTGKIHWELVQDPETAPDFSLKRPGFFIPVKNTMDSPGLRRLHSRIIERHSTLVEEKAGSDFLAQMLSNSLNAKVEYSPGGVLTVHHENDTIEVFTFGETGEKLERAASALGTTKDEVLRQLIVRRYNQIKDSSEGK